MCELCTQHGEGKTWYLNAKNYSVELANDLKRKQFIEQFYHEVIHTGNKTISFFEKPLLKKTGIPEKMRSRITAQQKESHFGQVVPIEDVEKILAMTNSITRISCGCRWAKERKESRTCYGLSAGPPDWFEGLDMDFFGSPDVSRFEKLSKEEALQGIQGTEMKGFVHSIWTFKSPFIGAICNCDLDYCLAMRTTVGLKTPLMFRSEFIGISNPAKCTGCRSCIDKCQFFAIYYDDTNNQCIINKEKCYGCGVCRTFCPEDAISLMARKEDPTVSGLW